MDYPVEYDFVIDKEDNMSMWNAPERGEVYLTPSQIIEANEPAAFGSDRQIVKRPETKVKKVSERKTPDWTPNLEDAFVDQEKVNKGKAAEAAVLKMFRDYYDYAYLNESSKELQLQGKDITFGFDSWRRPFTAQIKFDEMNYKCRIDIKQLLEQSADRWIHINPHTGVYAMYDAKEMKKYLRDQGLLDKQYTYIPTTKKREKFITVGFAKI